MSAPVLLRDIDDQELFCWQREFRQGEYAILPGLAPDHAGIPINTKGDQPGAPDRDIPGSPLIRYKKADAVDVVVNMGMIAKAETEEHCLLPGIDGP